MEKMTPFDQFWAVYPRKVAKITAQKAFAKALKLASLEALLDGARAYAEECEGKEPRFIAHPATWLNAGRWMDEIGRSGEIRLGSEQSRYRRATPEEVKLYQAENGIGESSYSYTEWVPKDWKPRLKIVS